MDPFELNRKSWNQRAEVRLQYHFGRDTLSWVRLGTDCTGVDSSPVTIAKTRQLNK